MEKSIRIRIFRAGVTAGTLLLAGCIGAGVDTGVEIGTTHVNNFGTGPTAQEVTGTAPKSVVGTRQIILLGDQKDLLRLSLKPEGVDADEKRLAAQIVQLVTGAVSSDDARVQEFGEADLRLTIRPKLATIDRDLDYYRMNCDVVIELKAVNSSRIFGAKTLKLVSPRRVLGRDAAIAQFDEPAARESAEWCRNELKRIADRELGVAVLTLQLPSVEEGKARNPQQDASNIKAIGDNLRKLPNLVSYEFVGQDEENGTCQFRVAYFKSAYPGGIANEVSALIGTIARHK